MDPQQNQPNPQSYQQPAFGYPTAPNPYPMQQQPQNKKKVLLMAGGVLVLVVILLMVAFGGKSTPGQQDMQATVENTSDAIGILSSYQDQVSSTTTKNDLALALIILRGNYQNLNTLYSKTYKSKKKFSAAPQPDKPSKAVLDEAERNNQLDSKISEVVRAKVNAAYANLQKSKANFKKASSVETLNTADVDLKSVYEILQEQ